MSADGDYARQIEAVGKALTERFVSASADGGYEDKWDLFHTVSETLRDAARLLELFNQSRLDYLYGEDSMSDEECNEMQALDRHFFPSTPDTDSEAAR